jgi:transposase
MSTSLIYHAFGLEGYTYLRTEYVGGEIHLRVRPKDPKLRCAGCGSREVIRKGRRQRRFRGLPIGRRPVWIVREAVRLGCRRCGAVKQAKVAFAPGRHRRTRRSVRHVLGLTRAMTMSDVARHLGERGNVVKAILKTDLERRFRRGKLKGLRRIATCEVSIERGHRYLTIVLDLDSGAVVFVGEGKRSDALDPFWKRLRRSGARTRAVATDMSQAWIRAVRTHLPDTPLSSTASMSRGS